MRAMAGAEEGVEETEDAAAGEVWAAESEDLWVEAQPVRSAASVQA
jgi:hypothetical protein